MASVVFKLKIEGKFREWPSVPWEEEYDIPVFEDITIRKLAERLSEELEKIYYNQLKMPKAERAIPSLRYSQFSMGRSEVGDWRLLVNLIQ
ncbi:hypothetical protein TWF694_003688 [Orbilia ellipsospora]|uniref:Uncharacterized protein n=1 Tax=Orbilia ellipsospora TaxID=2528407 RepID=A0AAV9X161_9PEZI